MKLNDWIKRLNVFSAFMLGGALLFAFPVAVAAEEKPDWKPQVGECAKDAKKFTDLFGKLEPDEQIEFLRAVNFALSHQPGSPEANTAQMLVINRSAAKNSSSTNRCAIVAETFATLPPEALAVIHERYALELFDRSKEGGPKSDEEFEKQAKELLQAIRARCGRVTAPGTRGVDRTGGIGSKYDDIPTVPGARTTLAVVMMLKASGRGDDKDLREAFMPYIETGSHVIARDEWIPAAMGDDDKEMTLDPLLASGDMGEAPDHDVVLAIAPMEIGVWLLGEQWIGKSWDVSGPHGTYSPRGLLFEAGMPLGAETQGAGFGRVPAGVNDPNSPFYSRRRGSSRGSKSDEPGYYNGQHR